MQRVLLGIALAVVFFGALVYLTLDLTGVECEVCMAYNGRRACESVSAQDRMHAEQQATSTACARISGGVTDGISCTRTQPESVRCTD